MPTSDEQTSEEALRKAIALVDPTYAGRRARALLDGYGLISAPPNGNLPCPDAVVCAAIARSPTLLKLLTKIAKEFEK